jgi:hypothetical protein
MSDVFKTFLRLEWKLLDVDFFFVVFVSFLFFILFQIKEGEATQLIPVTSQYSPDTTGTTKE